MSYYDSQVGRTLANVAASTTAGVVVNAISGFKIRVLAVVAVAGGTATDLTFNTNATAISPLFANGVRTPLVLPTNPSGWFETVAGDPLTVTTGAGSTTGVLVTWAQVQDVSANIQLVDESGSVLLDESGSVLQSEG